MILKVPSYYEKFHCIADQCKDNCCYGWEIDIDSRTAGRYRSLSQSDSPLARRLRENICCPSRAMSERQEGGTEKN